MPPLQQTPQPEERNNTALILTGLLCILLIGAGVYFSTYRRSGRTDIPAETNSSTVTDTKWDTLTLEAQAVYVLDARNREPLFAKNSDTPLPLASLTKLLTALVALTTLPEDTLVTIDASSLLTEGDSGLVAGETFALNDLVAFMLVVSSNDAATALRHAYESKTGGSFITAMNAESERLGLSLSFQNETGLDVGEIPANMGSARDVAFLMAETLRRIPDALDASRNDSFVLISREGNRHAVKSTNMIANDIPWSLGAKTGFTDSAGGNLAISLDTSIGYPVVIVVLGSSKEGRFSDVTQLVNATLHGASQK